MFCSRCGKKVLDSMLFCPFCGAEIIIPDQDTDAEAESALTGAKEPASAEPVRFSFSEAVEQAQKEVEETPVPAKEVVEPPEEKNADVAEKTEKEPEPEPVQEKETSEENPSLRLPDRATQRRVSMVVRRNDDEEEDDFDAFEQESDRANSRASTRRGQSPRRDDDYDPYDDFDDDDDEEGFFSRHGAAVVVIIILILLVGGAAVFALTDFGQEQLAKLDLPISLPLGAEVYSRLGYSEYQEGDFTQAAAYYERALERDPTNYNYSSSAAMAYVHGKDTAKAVDMLKKCIELNNGAVEPYALLVTLYPDAESRPMDVAQLIEQGYRITGDARLMTETEEIQGGMENEEDA